MGYCHEHRKRFEWTCAACDAAWEYMGRTQYLEAFHAGVRGDVLQERWKQDTQQHAAYLHGLEYCTKQKEQIGKPTVGVRDKKKKQKHEKPERKPAMPRKKTNDASLTFDSLVGSTTVSKSETKKKKLPQIKLDTTNSGNLRKFLSYKVDMKDAETNMRSAEQPLLTLCLDRQDEDALSGHFYGSYELVTDDGQTTAKYVSVDKFNLSQDPEVIDALRDVLGDKFDEEVEKTTLVMLKPEVFNDKKLKAELVKLLGAQFGKFFQSVVTYKMKSEFDERLYKYASTAADAQQLRVLANKSKSSLK